MDNVAGVIILYNPNRESVIRNISSYIDHISELLVIDNSELKDLILIEMIKRLDKPISYQSNAVNEGIAKPLNDAGAWAVSKGYSWLLTMDQDSHFEDGDIRKYMHWVSTEAPEDMAISGISFVKDDQQKRLVNSDFEVVYKVITSGSVIRLRNWELLKGFDEQLFIDEVDHEFCYHAIERGFNVYKLNHIYMIHEMGKVTSGGYFGNISKRPRMVHSPLRIYYMVRNYCAVRRRYRKLLPLEFKERNKELRIILKNNLFFSGKLIETIQMAVKGYIHYRRGVFGKYNI